ncbi:hypothetical protein ABZX95_22235 [Streptomyces sp. NPDC004232]|uniref:hypothetical protein n=1 Tax=Streptomyces sp. NPDC004232 TaxID=3154454 RepID=UPI001D919FBC|nr:hypothetical protein [Streptomyces sp. tea 10]
MPGDVGQGLGEQRRRNSMPGLRGVRLGIVVPGLVRVQAITEAVAERTRAGGSARAEIVLPHVGAVGELRLTREEMTRIPGSWPRPVRRPA